MITNNIMFEYVKWKKPPFLRASTLWIVQITHLARCFVFNQPLKRLITVSNGN